MSTNPIVGRTTRDGIQVSTVFLVDRGYWETCLFDDRNGKRYGNSSRVVDGYDSETDAIDGHRRYSSLSATELAGMLDYQATVN